MSAQRKYRTLGILNEGIFIHRNGDEPPLWALTRADRDADDEMLWVDRGAIDLALRLPAVAVVQDHHDGRMYAGPFVIREPRSDSEGLRAWRLFPAGGDGEGEILVMDGDPDKDPQRVLIEVKWFMICAVLEMHAQAGPF